MKKLAKLPRGEGSFNYRSNGTIEFKKYVHVNNGTIRAVVYGNTERECMEKMRQKETEIKERGKFTSDQLLGEALEMWINKVKKNTLKKQSYNRLMGAARQIQKADFGHRFYGEIGTTELQNFIDHLIEQRYAWGTIKKAYDLLRAFYRYMSIKEQFRDPMALVVMPRKDNVKFDGREIQWFEEEDIQKFTDACGARWNTGRLKYKYSYAIAANIYLGLRGGELLALQWKDVDFEKNTVYVSKTLIEYREKNGKTKFEVQESTKRDKNRYVPMNSKAKNFLLKHLNECEFTEPDDYVISTYNRKTTTLKNLSDVIGNIEEEANTTVRANNTHILRHTCASLYFRAGVPIETICAILGNTREVCEKTYVHFAEEQLKNAASKIVPIIEL